MRFEPAKPDLIVEFVIYPASHGLLHTYMSPLQVSTFFTTPYNLQNAGSRLIDRIKFTHNPSLCAQENIDRTFVIFLSNLSFIQTEFHLSISWLLLFIIFVEKALFHQCRTPEISPRKTTKQMFFTLLL